MVKLGTKVKDKITGVSGVATARSDYLYGCVRICVEYLNKKSGELKELWFDEQRLEKKSKAGPGGPKSVAPARSVFRHNKSR